MAHHAVTRTPVPGVDHRLAEQIAEAHELLTSPELAYTTAPDRLAAVAKDILATGTYWQADRELVQGTRLAWRNATRCVGRLSWARLRVVDRRDLRHPDDIAEASIEHLRQATNGGRVRLQATVFAPARDTGGVRILNRQLISYAGYRSRGEVVGDPQTLALTKLAQSLGWRGAGGPFDVLPLVLQCPGSRPRWYPVPRDAVLEVAVTHPEHPWLADVGLRWYAHPAISDQRLRIGGVDYPAAPFSAWYTAVEVARDLGGRARYNVLPQLAARMGLVTSTTRSRGALWRDRVWGMLIEAVAHSFTEQGIAIVDHHQVARGFRRFQARERAAGRPVYGDWRVLVPAFASSVIDLDLDINLRPDTVLPNFFAPSELDGQGESDVGAAGGQQ